ncbi:MAG TPA: hypothetical protein VIQ39_02330, partial [Methyloceanibacter sp.]
IGALDLFVPELLRPEAMRWRTALRAVRSEQPMPELPPSAVVVLETPAEARRLLLATLGFRALGPQMLRVDLVERLAKHAFEAKAGKRERAVDEALVISLGLRAESVVRLMRDLGFRATEGAAGWVWKGRSRSRHQAPAPVPGHAFAGLASLRRV